MTQTQEPALAALTAIAPSVSLASLREQSIALGKGIEGISKEIARYRHLANQLEKNLYATDGAKKFVDDLIKGLEKAPVDEIPLVESPTG